MIKEPSVLVALLALISSIAGILLTNRAAARAARSAQETAEKQRAALIEAESFKRARENYDAALAEQEQRITRLRTALQTEHDDSQTEMAECRRQIADLRRDFIALREWSRPLLQKVREAGIPYPDPPVWLGNGRSEGNS